MAYPEMEEMLWFAERWLWFPGRQISVESQFKWEKRQGLHAGTRWHRRRGNSVCWRSRD